jgi:hypothetical protein
LLDDRRIQIRICTCLDSGGPKTDPDPQHFKILMKSSTLFRVYGLGTEAIIDRAAELENMQRLAARGV